jgi:hypothetical protein
LAVQASVDGFGPPPGTAVEERPALLHRVNDVMRAGRRAGGDKEAVPFFCECERSDCYAPLWLSPAHYDDRRGVPGSLVLPGHEQSERQRTPHEKAAILAVHTSLA